MTTRQLPQINAYQAPAAVDWDSPVSAREAWQPVKAAHDDERTVNIYGEIGDHRDVPVGNIRAALRRIGSGDITVNINSTGGDFFAGLAIYNLLREHDGGVTTNVVGLAASAASVIAMASDTLRVAKAGFLMIHNSWGIVIGNKADMIAVADTLARFDKAMAGVYSDRSGIDHDEIVKFMDDETFFSGEEAVENGLADELLASDQIAEAPDPEPVAAARLIDLELARAGMPRSTRRALLNGLKDGTPGAAVRTTPRAGDLDSLASLREIVSTIKTG